MARIAAVERAYFYPTPRHLLSDIADLVHVDAGYYGQRIRMLDPCAGDGIAATTIFDKIGSRYSSLSMIELDVSRAKKAEYEARLLTAEDGIDVTVHQGDAERAYSTSYRPGLLYLNPPYDACKEYGRLENRWLQRFTGWLNFRGVLLFVVPDYALASCAEYLAENYADIRIARFPEPDYSVYKQVVLVARKKRTEVADPAVVSLLREAPSSQFPILGSDWIQPVSGDLYGNYGAIRIRPYSEEDAVKASILTGCMWAPNKRGQIEVLPGTLAEFPDLDHLDRQESRVYPLPLSAAHVAQAIGGGLLDGVVVSPDDPDSNLPHLAVRGTYDRNWHKTGVKRNKKGEIVAHIEQQQPSLIIVAVDLQTGVSAELAQTVDPRYSPEKFERADSGVCCHCERFSDSEIECVNPDGHEEFPGIKEVDSPIQLFSAGDLLEYYGHSLRKVLDSRCTPLLTEEASEAIKLLDYGRNPFRAQRPRIAAGVEMIRRGQRGVIIAGETGTGKTTISAQIAAVLSEGVGRILVITPAHVAPGWRDEQIPEILGKGVDVRMLESLSDVDRWIVETENKLTVGVVARSKGKLGYYTVDTGRPTDTYGAGNLDRAARRQKLAEKLGFAEDTCPGCGYVSAEEQRENRAKKRHRCTRIVVTPLTARARSNVAVLGALAPLIHKSKTTAQVLPPRLLSRYARKEPISPLSPEGLAFVEGALRCALNQPDPEPVALTYLAQLVDDERLVQEALARVGEVAVNGTISDYEAFWQVVDSLGGSGATMNPDLYHREPCNHPLYGAQSHDWGDAPWQSLVTTERQLAGSDVTPRRAELASQMTGAGPLRRYPLIRYIYERYRREISFGISDESHESSNSDTAARTADQLMYQLGCPWIAMTGTLTNGYARSLFVPLWFASAEFRKEYGYHDAARFQRDCGFNRRRVEDTDEKGRVVAFGSTSACKQRIRPESSPAPGIVPTAIMRYLLPVTLTIRIEDLDLDLPPCVEETIHVEADSDQFTNWNSLESKLRQQLKQDAWSPQSGALLGQLGLAQSYLDRCTADVGNCDAGTYRAAYPEKHGGKVVSEIAGLDPTRIMPKERYLIDYCLAAKEASDRVIVCVQHIGASSDKRGARSLPERLVDLLTRSGLTAEYMASQKVPPRKRIEWINKLNRRGNDVLICHPTAIMTGLNNLVTYNHVIHFQPDNSADRHGQVRGRIHRPGATKPGRVLTLVYSGTSQELLNANLMRKVAVARATGGSDPLEALRSVGADDDGSVTTQSFAEMLLDS